MLDDQDKKRGTERLGQRRREALERTFGRMIGEENRKMKEEKHRQHMLECGNGKYINEASVARYNCLPYDDSMCQTEAEKRSYYYGYMIRGSRRLLSKVEQLIEANGFVGIENIAENDVANEVPVEHLSMLLKYHAYKEAYEKASAKKRKIK